LALRNSINDKNTRNKIEKTVFEVIGSMEHSMNRILIQVVANKL
jgi:hypothetical protein